MSYGWRRDAAGRLVEHCDECGFDGANASPATGIPAALEALSRATRSGDAAVRPKPGVWSADEYVAHCLDMCGETVAVVRDGRTEPRAVLPDLDSARTALLDLMQGEACADPEREIELGGPFPATPRWMLVHLQHDLEHHLLDVRRGHAHLALERGEGPTIER